MKTRITITLVSVLLVSVTFSQAAPATIVGSPRRSDDPLLQNIQHFQFIDGSLLEGMARLSLSSVPGLHLGVEEALRDKFSSPQVPEVRFSLDLKNKSVRAILDTLCNYDFRYLWSRDGNTINVYPRTTEGDPEYFLSRRMERLYLDSIKNPDEVFAPLHQRFPKEPIVYMQAGGDISYREPWTESFINLSVRQLINRAGEHLGSRSSWVMRGSKDAPIFTFENGGFEFKN